MWSLGFGLERVAHIALYRPRLSTVALLCLVAASIFGLTQVKFDEDLRAVFAGENDTYRDYVRITEEFVDPENENLLLVEGADLGTPENFGKLQELQFELQFIEGVDNVFSLFALRHAPDANGDASLVVADTSRGLTPELAAEIRGHPLLGEKLLSPDGTAMIYVVTPTERKAPLATVRVLKAEIEKTAESILGDADLVATVTGFPAMRAGIVDILIRDQLRLNLAGVVVGFLVSLIAFRSLIGAVMTAVPAIVAGLAVLGGMGLLGVPVTAMSNIIPALAMIVGYADGIHLSHAWRHHRDSGATPWQAERMSQVQVGAACMLTAITTSVSFLALTISDVAILRNFGWTGAIGMLFSGMIVIFAHALLAQFIGPFWKASRGGSLPDIFKPLAAPCAAICRFAVDNARTISLLILVLFVALAMAYAQFPADYSVREHLPEDDPANAALGRIDQSFDGAFPVQIVVPMDGLSPTSPEGLEKVKAVHEAIEKIPGVESPLSLWSLVEWFGGAADEETAARITADLDQLSPAARSRFLGADGTATLVSASLEEKPTYVTLPLIEEIEQAAKAAGGPDVIVTGVTVVTARESTRTIDNLNVSLTFAILGDLSIMILAFRRFWVGFLAVLSNTMPVLATCAILFLMGRGMQLNTVIALIVAFGVTVDETTHYLNHFIHHGRSKALGERLIETTRRVGPVLIGTTIIILCGLATTLSSGLPTVTLFGIITALTLLFALVGDLF
ncbi:MAG TPA: MMPL family transporter, partial [Bauldia sp.]|nr:MMPL family transporter [Bauldia sp.]